MPGAGGGMAREARFLTFRSSRHCPTAPADRPGSSSQQHRSERQGTAADDIGPSAAVGVHGQSRSLKAA